MKILIATDGSKQSEAIIEASCRTIRTAETADVKIISVFEQPLMAVAAAPYAIPVQYNTHLEKELLKQFEHAVGKAERQICERVPGIEENLTTQILRGSPAQAIVEEAERWGADLIVLGSHGYGFWERMFLGSVSNAVLHHAPCSVLIVKNRGNAVGNEV